MMPVPRNWIYLVGVFIVTFMLLRGSRDSGTIKKLQEKLHLAEEKIIHLEGRLNSGAPSANLEQPVLLKRELGRDLDSVAARATIVKDVTVILYAFEETEDCLKARIDQIVKEYPQIEICVVTSTGYGNPSSHKVEYIPNIEKEGQALVTATKKLNTKYFLYLSTGSEISPHVSDYSIGWLLHALEKIPELDFIGGSFLRYTEGLMYPVFEVNCYRLRLCNWTFSQSYEYRYSIGDMMVCEETSPSFMGRVSSLQKVGLFDANLDTLATTDFFLRAKGKAMVGLRPEVRFTLSAHCRLPVWSKMRETDLKLEFMRKHQLHIIRDSWGKEVHSSDSQRYSTLKYGNDHMNEYTYANPLYIQGLQLNLEIAADFFESKNISYFLDAGFPLGGLKFRGILPWDYDIDLGFFTANWKEVEQGLKDLCKERHIPVRINTANWNQIKNMHMMTMWAGKFGMCDMYQHVEVDEDWFMYVYIHGRPYPVMKNLTTYFRRIYGLHYLEHRGKKDQPMECKLTPGHHACVPKEFASGAGHWRDLYCQI